MEYTRPSLMARRNGYMFVKNVNKKLGERISGVQEGKQ